MYGDHKVVIGIAPSRRDSFPDKRNAIELKKQMMPVLKEMIQKCGNVEIVDIDWVNEEGILVENSDVKKVADCFIQKKVDAVFMPHFNFGQEEAVGKLGKAVGKPVLLWGPRDERPPEGRATRQTDTQCGLFVSAKALSRHNVPFTYIENCRITDKVLEKGISDFIAVADVVKTFHNIRVGQISVRPRQFLSVRINENQLLEKFGVDVVTINSQEILTRVNKLLNDRPEDYQQIKKEIMESVECKMTPDELNKVAALEQAILETAKLYDIDAMASECWSIFGQNLGIRPCFVFGDCMDHGLPVACEADVNGAISAALLMAAARGKKPGFIADITIRHPDNDNGELLWHCGPFPKSLAKEGENCVLVGGHGQWELKGGDITVVRFDEEKGNYLLFADEAKGTNGPVTDGNYVWIETDDWVKWEKKFIYGPYIHHVAAIHGNYAEILHEACKYMIDVKPDKVN